jgi:DNA-binding NarL/FixJ family response regulator
MHSRATPDSTPVTVILVDEQQKVLGAIGRALSAAGLEVVGEAETTTAGVRAAVDLRPDVVLMDFEFPGRESVDAIAQISTLAPTTRTLALAATKASTGLVEAIVAGACGYVLKDAGLDAIVNGVRASAAGECVISSEIAGALLARIREREIPITAAGEHPAETIRALLTERELAIFKQLASGESNQEIGHVFSLSENTIKNHIASILAKLHLDNRVQAAVQAVRSGLACLPIGWAIYPVLNNGTGLPGEVLLLFTGG